MGQEKAPQAAGTHRRRVHYSGKYPRRFEEKYKEQQPEKYGAQIAHVIAKGNTPAGMHIPIMVEEILAVLADEFGLPVAVSEADIHRTALTGRGRDLIDLVG